MKQGVNDADELVMNFRAEYKEKGSRDLLYQVTYLSQIAQRYEKKDDWPSLLRAHALYNSCAVRDTENSDRWLKKGHHVQVSYWKEELLSFSKQIQLSSSLKVKLTEIRARWKARTQKIMELFKGLCCEPDELRLMVSSQQRIYDSVLHDVPELSILVNQDMIAFSNVIASTALEICGIPPCRFCIVGLGSLAREEATPYSDLEFLFLMECSSPEMIQYLKKLAVTMYFIIGNLGETNLKYMAIPELLSWNHTSRKYEHWFKDGTMSGFKIDGLNEMAGNIPTGNGSVEQDNHFITTVGDLVARYERVLNHPDTQLSLTGDLTAMLSSTVFISGSYDLLADLKTSLASFKPNTKRREATAQMLLNDSKKFDFKPTPNLTHLRRMKSDVYRYPSMIILDLRILHNLWTSDPWTTVKLLKRIDVITESTSECLRFSLCCALLVRLSTYFHRNSQCDDISVLSSVTYENECQGAWYVPIKLLIHMFINLVPLKDAVTEAVRHGSERINVRMSKKSCFETVALVRYYCEDYRKVLSVLRALHGDKFDSMNSFIQQVYIHSAIECGECMKAEKLLRKKSSSGDCEHIYLYLQGLLFQNQCRFDEAFISYKSRLHILRGMYGYSDHEDIANTYSHIGVILDLKGQPERALKEYKKSFDVLQVLHGDDRNIATARVLCNMGAALCNLSRFADALVKYQQSLKIYLGIYGERDHANVASVLCNIGTILLNSKQRSEALTSYLKGLWMYQRFYGGRDHVAIAGVYRNIGQVFNGQLKYEKALEEYKKCLCMLLRLFGKQDRTDIAGVLCDIATTLCNQCRYSEALEEYTKGLKMLRTIHRNGGHMLIAAVLHNIGLILCHSGQYDLALLKLRSCLSMYTKIYGGVQTSHTTAVRWDIIRVESLRLSAIKLVSKSLGHICSASPGRLCGKPSAC